MTWTRTGSKGTSRKRKASSRATKELEREGEAQDAWGKAKDTADDAWEKTKDAADDAKDAVDKRI